ncbi:hypothetical protein AAG906_000551 [Vitis piasezkii]
MDVSLESKSLPSVGYSRKSYLQVTSQRLARDKLVNLHGRRSLALPSVGPSLHEISQTKRVANHFAAKVDFALKLAFSLRCSASNMSQLSGKFRRKSTACAKRLRNHFATKSDFATLCKILPSAWSDRLAMAVTPSFQLRITYRLKHWILDFLSFEMVYSMHKLDSRKCSKSKEEIQKQLSVGFISVVEYPEWLANVVPVPKKDGKILMAPEDMEKTTFITEWGTYCYRVMPFGLKNAGATYQRAATTLFHDMMHREV